MTKGLKAALFSPAFLLALPLVAVLAITPDTPGKQPSIPPYNRDAFRHWIDADRDCQDTRAELLLGASRVPPALDKKGCLVKMGSWYDPYTGKTRSKASWFDIDHIVPLEEAWQKGAWAWTRERREEFANDPQNLLIVSKQENRRKQGKTPADYMPPNRGYHCQYLRQWLIIKQKYGLLMDTAEAVFVVGKLGECGK